MGAKHSLSQLVKCFVQIFKGRKQWKVSITLKNKKHTFTRVDDNGSAILKIILKVFTLATHFCLYGFCIERGPGEDLL